MTAAEAVAIVGSSCTGPGLITLPPVRQVPPNNAIRRRKPAPVRRVIELLAKVYKNDDIARKEKMSPQERLSFHQAHSAKPMAKLEHWMREQIDEKKVEPNSGLGGAISCMLNR